MNGMPWHPAVVHLPIGLGLVVPIVALILAIALRRGAVTRRAWSLVVLLQALVFAGGLVAMRTGEAEEERVEDVVAEDLIEEHEESAEVFVWLAGAALGAGVGGLVLPQGAVAAAAVALAVTCSTAAAGAVLWTGHQGGSLVYIHGATRAYQTAPPAAAGEARRPDPDD